MKISEIAKLAGVSSAAVSRYINGGSISEEKKQKIKKVIEETGYVPNPAARSLRQQRTDSIGIIVPRINSDSVSNLIEGVSSVLNKNVYMSIFGNTENDEKRDQAEMGERPRSQEVCCVRQCLRQEEQDEKNCRYGKEEPER